MEPDTNLPSDQDPPSHEISPQANDPFARPILSPVAPPEVESGIRRFFIGPQGLRAGWSVLIFIVLFVALFIAIGLVLRAIHAVEPTAGFTPRNVLFNELDQLVALLSTAWVMTLIERRRLLDYNLTGPRPARHFFSGLAVGFIALSGLVASLAAGGWLHFGGAALSGAAILQYGLFWGCAFLIVGCVEEGTFRCYLQYTFTRGLNFWWALGIVAFLCAILLFTHKGNGAWGDYAIALLGLLPCYILHQKGAAHSAFWQAAWVTSTLFGFAHTTNGGENWVGIFSAAAIGFVFCVSIRVTGSAWWAIGAHAGWDWAETYFYGTADSGFVPKGHFLTTTPAGNALWSGGSDGPEGSILILGILLLMLVWLVVVYGRRHNAQPAPAAEFAPQ